MWRRMGASLLVTVMGAAGLVGAATPDGGGDRWVCGGDYVGCQ